MIDTSIIKGLLFSERKFIVYGAGYRGDAVVRNMLDLGLNISCIVDKDSLKHGSEIYGIEICPVECMDSMSGDNTYIIVSVEQGKEIHKTLSDKFNVMPFVTAEYILRLSYLNCEAYGYNKVEYMGSFMSPYPSYNIDKTFDDLYDIDLNMDTQEKYYNSFLNLYKKIDFSKTCDRRYSEDNTKYGIADALVLYGMIRLLKPNRIVEIGSGYSSAIMLDTNEYCMDGKIKIEFIEPFANRLKSLLKQTDKISLQEKFLQDANIDSFERLGENDILFIDSSHVSKRGSDVNQIFFDVLPRLKNGVYIHIHDVFANFDYPDEWVKNGWAWNEDYLLRAFLMNNNAYEIVFFTNLWNKRFRETGLIPNYSLSESNRILTI